MHSIVYWTKHLSHVIWFTSMREHVLELHILVKCDRQIHDMAGIIEHARLAQKRRRKRRLHLPGRAA